MRPIDADDLLRRVKIETNPYGAPTLEYRTGVKVMEMIKQAPTVQVAVDWIPFKLREMTETEREIYPEVTETWADPMPDDDQIILITDGTTAWTDKFQVDYDDGSCYLASDVNIEEGMAWVPCPKLYKKENGNADRT